jgi:hypothetical protein
LLRRVGILGVVAGLIYVALAVGGWALFSLDSRTPSTDEVLMVALMGVLGLLVVLVGVGALTAASRFPVVAHMAGSNDFVSFLASTLAGVGLVALVIRGALELAILPMMALVTFLFLSSAVRKVVRSPEARAPGGA